MLQPSGWRETRLVIAWGASQCPVQARCEPISHCAPPLAVSVVQADCTRSGGVKAHTYLCALIAVMGMVVGHIEARNHLDTSRVSVDTRCAHRV